MRSKCITTTIVILALHAILAMASETYGGLVGGLPAMALAWLTGWFGGRNSHGEPMDQVAHVVTLVPAVLVVEGALILIIGLWFCRRRSRAASR